MVSSVVLLGVTTLTDWLIFVMIPDGGQAAQPECDDDAAPGREPLTQGTLPQEGGQSHRDPGSSADMLSRSSAVSHGWKLTYPIWRTCVSPDQHSIEYDFSSFTVQHHLRETRTEPGTPMETAVKVAMGVLGDTGEVRPPGFIMAHRLGLTVPLSRLDFTPSI